jgi:cytochrome b6-f complex iron-sulfur subunit
MAAAATAARGGAPTETRRGLLAFAGWGTIALLALQGAMAFIVFFWPRKLGTFGAPVSAGAPSEYQVGDVKYFVDGKFYLSRLEEGFIALYQKCVHLGCTVPWRPEFEWPYEGQTIKGLFRCPCHGSTYLRNGQIIYGPAPRPLDYMPITLQNGQLVVNTGSIRKRESWDPSQAFKA